MSGYIIINGRMSTIFILIQPVYDMVDQIKTELYIKRVDFKMKHLKKDRK